MSRILINSPPEISTSRHRYLSRLYRATRCCDALHDQISKYFFLPTVLFLASCSGGADLSHPGYTDACHDTEQGLVVCPASDMAKTTRTENLVLEHPDFDWSKGPVRLHAARNETIAFQLILRKTVNEELDDIEIEFDGLAAPNVLPGNTDRYFSQFLFSAFYLPIDNAGYQWGPPTEVLPWPAEYPDALVPLQGTCQAQPRKRHVGISPPPGNRTNQALWVDTYVHSDTQPGTYSQDIILRVNGETHRLPLQITVHNTTLPDKPSINAVGELYRSYFLEGAGYDITSEQWSEMSQCYQQLAHQHRMVFVERLPDLLTAEQTTAYVGNIAPALSGDLFSTANGYIGPGVNTPVSIWRTPWPQNFDRTLTEPIGDREIDRYRRLASAWSTVAAENAWIDTDFFAYVFDEVDGPATTGNNGQTREQYIAMVHDQMDRVQNAIDAGVAGSGSGVSSIDLLWTSHSNPAIWQDDPELDLRGKIRLWVPNATAADTGFLGDRIAAGDKAWFYHSGHPAVGAHSINTSGIEMRTWGVIGARYGFQGQFMWALNFGSNDFPFRDPQYNPDDDRAGNGVLVYPGNQLDRIGYQKSPGPVPSMRLKAWRRGLQDAELYFLAQTNDRVATEQLLQQQMPSALSEGDGAASWSSNSADWINFHRRLLELASP